MDVNHQLFQIQFSPGFFSHLIFAGGDVFMGPRVRISVTFTKVRLLLWAESLEHWENGPVEDVTAENQEFALLKLTKWYSTDMDHDMCTVRYILNQ